MDLLKDFLMDVKKMDVKKQVKHVKNRLPEVRYSKGFFEGKDLLIGIAIGGALGYLAALVFAPRPGEETRAYLSGKGNEIRQKAQNTIDGAVNKTNRLTTEGRDRVETALRSTQKQIDVTKGQAKVYTTEVREQLSDTLYHAADKVDPKPRV